MNTRDIDTQVLRKIVLVAVISAVLGGAIFEVATGTLAVFGLGMLRFICPVGFLEVTLATRSIVWEALPFTLLTLAAVFVIGRFPCGWICPIYKFKHWLQGRVPLDRIQSTTDRVPFDVTWRDGVAVLIGVLAVSAITGYPLYCVFCPIGIVSRNLISLGTHLTIHPDLLLVPLYVLVVALFADWQRVCPVGNLGGLANQVAPLQPVQVNVEACTQCESCVQVCPEEIPLFDPDVDMGACTACLRCYETCPAKAIRLPQIGRAR